MALASLRNFLICVIKNLGKGIGFALLFLPFFLKGDAQNLGPSLPQKLYLEDAFIDECKNAQSYNNSYFSSWGEYLRDAYLMPLHQESLLPPYLYNSEEYADCVVRMLKEGEGPFDPTFANFSDIVKRFSVRDIDVEVKSSEKTYLFRSRILESRYGRKLRIVLFTFNQNLEKDGDNWICWNPTSSAEIGASALEVLKAFQQHITIDSMMCVSMGGIVFDTLQYMEKDILPKTLVWNRGLTSTWKAGASVLSYPTNCFLHWAARYFGLYADPEQVLLDHCVLTRDKRLVVIEAVEDYYFSGESGLDPEFFEKLSGAGITLYQGKFQVPILEPRAHHACRLDWIVHSFNTGNVTENFLPINPYETLSDCLARHLFLEEGEHTCFIVGANIDTLNSMVYLHALPLLSSFCKHDQ